MKRLNDISITIKLSAIIFLVSFLALFVSFIAMTFMDTRSFKNAIKDDAIANARLAAEYSVASLAFNYKEDADKILANLAMLREVNGAAIYDKNGKLFSFYKRTAAPFKQTAVMRSITGETSANFTKDKLEIYEPMLYNGVQYGTLYMDVSTTALSARLNSRIKMLSILALCTAFFAFLLATRIQRLLSEPVLRLAQIAMDIAGNQDYSIRLTMNRGDEIGTLARGFNAMLESLDASNKEKSETAIALKQAHDELEQKVEERTRQLTLANKELEAFSYSASHDLRSPLRRIYGFSALLEQELGVKLSSDARLYLERIKTGCGHMSEVIDNLLKLSKVMRREMSPQAVNLSEEAADIIKLLKEAEPERELEFVNSSSRLEIYADQGLIREALENLLSNAWKFTRKTKNARIELGCFEEAGKKTYFVADNGCGFDMAYKNKLFQPFHRLHTEEEFAGTGIGLSIVQRAIGRHGGQIWAESEVGKGTTFFFTLTA